MSNVSASIALAAVFSASVAQAQTSDAHVLGQHPAVIVAARVPVIDPNLYIVRPPASVSWVRLRANGQHPAVLVSSRASTIDSNTFQVQPPASVTWKLQSTDDAAPLLASNGR